MPQTRTKRAHVLLPEDLAREIDLLAGRRGRSAFLVETARQEVRRRKLLAFLEQDDVAWKEPHPELQKGSAHWVSALRKSSERLKTRRPKKSR